MTPTQMIIIGLAGLISPRILALGVLVIGIWKIFFN